MTDILMALQHLHRHNLIHLDVKPENIFFSSGDICKLGDFGLVIDLNKVEPNEDAMEGDPKYLAKELMQGKFTPAADVFSLGITVLEMACDIELPNSGNNWHLLRDGNIPFETFNPISQNLRQVIISMMAPDYRRRPTTSELLSLSQVCRYSKQRILHTKLYRFWDSIKSKLIQLVHFLHLAFIFRLFPHSDHSINVENDEYVIQPDFDGSLLDQSFSEDDVFDSAHLE